MRQHKRSFLVIHAHYNWCPLLVTPISVRKNWSFWQSKDTKIWWKWPHSLNQCNLDFQNRSTQTWRFFWERFLESIHSSFSEFKRCLRARSRRPAYAQLWSHRSNRRSFRQTRNNVCPVYSKEPRRSLCIQLKNAKLYMTGCDNKLRKRGIRKFCHTYINIVVIIGMS